MQLFQWDSDPSVHKSFHPKNNSAKRASFSSKGELHMPQPCNYFVYFAMHNAAAVETLIDHMINFEVGRIQFKSPRKCHLYSSNFGAGLVDSLNVKCSRAARQRHVSIDTCVTPDICSIVILQSRSQLLGLELSAHVTRQSGHQPQTTCCMQRWKKRKR